LGRNRWTQQEGDSLGCAWNTDPTISTCPLTSTSSITRESVRHAPCPDSPSHSQKVLKVAPRAPKVRGETRSSCPTGGLTNPKEETKPLDKLPPFPFRTLTCMPYSWC
jgi:hypothetical protein